MTANSPVEVRLAVAPDAAAVADLAGRTFASACPPTTTAANIAEHIRTKLNADCFRMFITDPDQRLTVATTDGETIVGYALLRLAPPPEEIAHQLNATPAAELSKIYVDPDHHGGTIARALVVDLVARASEAGSAAVWLGTNHANARAQRFYTKVGFTRVGERRYQVGDGIEDDFVYELRLQRPEPLSAD